MASDKPDGPTSDHLRRSGWQPGQSDDQPPASPRPSGPSPSRPSVPPPSSLTSKQVLAVGHTSDEVDVVSDTRVAGRSLGSSGASDRAVNESNGVADDGRSRFGGHANPNVASSGSGDTSTSMQTFLVVLTLVFMLAGVGAIALAAIILIPQKTPQVSTTTQPVSPEQPGVVELDDESLGDLDIQRRRVVHSGPAPVAAVAPAAPVLKPLVINIGDGTHFNGVQVKCPGGQTSAQVNFKGSRATVPDVPTDQSCTVIFRGGQSARTTARGGQNLTCTFGGVTNCR